MVRGKNSRIFVFLIMGILFAIAGLALAYYKGNDVLLTCNRSTDFCAIEKTNALGNTKTIEDFSLKKLAGAEIFESNDSGDDYTYKVMLILNQRRIPFSNYFSSGYKTHKANALIINDYVTSKQEYLEIKQSGRVMKIVGFVFAGFGGLLLLGFLGELIKYLIFLIVMSLQKK